MLLRIALPLYLVLASCHVLQVDTAGGPPRIESRGLVDSHVAVGVPSETHILHANLFSGTSSGAVAELTIWKLFHLELGLAGVAIGLGPLHVGIGIAFYDPEIPVMMHDEPSQSWSERRDAGEDEEADEVHVPEPEAWEELDDA